MTTVSDNFGLIVKAFLTLAGVTMSAFHIYSTNKISLLKTSEYLVDYNDKYCSILTCNINSHFLNNNVWRHTKRENQVYTEATRLQDHFN